MTFILSIKTDQGIILGADSKETLVSGYMLWEDFDALLKAKNVDELSVNECLSPSEIADMFHDRSTKTEGRVRSIEGVKKIFRITTHIAVLIAGKANPGGQEFSKTVDAIKDKIIIKKTEDFNEIVEMIFDEVKTQFDKDVDGDDKFNSEQIICGYDLSCDKFKVFKLVFKVSFDRDSKGKLLKDKNGSVLRSGELIKKELDQVLTAGGITNCLGELGEFNTKSPNLNLAQAFNLSKQILNLAVTIEEYTEMVPAIGGELYFAAITRRGFEWLTPSSNPLNLLE